MTELKIPTPPRWFKPTPEDEAIIRRWAERRAERIREWQRQFDEAEKQR